MHIMEKRAEQARARLNTAKAHNQQLRDNIDNQRRHRGWCLWLSLCLVLHRRALTAGGVLQCRSVASSQSWRGSSRPSAKKWNGWWKSLPMPTSSWTEQPPRCSAWKLRR